MIFISYNHKDEALVDMVARRLELEFGRDNIFYDKWSIQPGDSIIGKMNEGLEKFTTLFYFLSPNSLNSKMVTKEWQNALMKSINENLKFVPIRIAECKPPAILTDSLYIDLYGSGLDDAVAKMKCVVNGENTYTALNDVDNVTAIIKEIKVNEIQLEIKANMYSENDANFAFVCSNEIDEFEVTTEDPIHYSSTGEMIGYNNRVPVPLKMKTIKLYRPLTTSNPMKVKIKGVNNVKLNFIGIMQVFSNTSGKPIQVLRE